MGVHRRKEREGLWRAVVWHQGRRVAVRDFPSKELAQAYYNVTRTAVLKGELGIKTARTAITFRELATGFLVTTERQLRPGTLRYYRHRLARYIVPALGSTAITDISKASVVHYLDSRVQDGISAASRAKEQQIIQRLLNWAVEKNLLDANPAARLRSPRAPRSFEPVFYTPTQVEAILSPLKGNALGLMLAAFRTGMRQRELVHFDLSWCDFDRNIVRIPNSLEFSPKSHKPRTVPLSEDLKAWLLTRAHRRGRVFLSERAPHGPLHGFRKLLARVEKLAGYHVKLHDCRHTYASFLVAAGVPLPEVQAALGHSSITTTMIYAHLSPSYLENVRAALAGDAGRRRGGLKLVG